MKSLKLEDICPCCLVLKMSRQDLSHLESQFQGVLASDSGSVTAEAEARGLPRRPSAACTRLGLGSIPLCVSKVAHREPSLNVGWAGREGVTERWYGGHEGGGM